MAPLLTVDDLLALLRMSDASYLIVEGVDDRYALQELFWHSADDSSAPGDLEVFRIEEFEAPQFAGLGNRERVEVLSEALRDQPCRGMVACLVDREFRLFCLEPEVCVDPPDIANLAPLLWTCGHSFENYFFHQSIVPPLVRRLCRSPIRGMALEILEGCFDELVATAASLSVAAFLSGEHGLLQATVRSTHFDFSGSSYHFLESAWLQQVEAQFVNRPNLRTSIRTYFAWARCRCLPSPHLARLIHGHGGVHFFRCVLAACVFQLESDAGVSTLREHKKIEMTSNERLFEYFLAEWIRRYRQAEVPGPDHVFRTLGMEPPRVRLR